MALTFHVLDERDLAKTLQTACEKPEIITQNIEKAQAYLKTISWERTEKDMLAIIASLYADVDVVKS